MTERWYQDKQLLKAAYEEYGSFAAIVENVGGADRTTLSKWWRKHRLGSLPYGPHPQGVPNKDALQRLAKKIYANGDS